MNMLNIECHLNRVLSLITDYKSLLDWHIPLESNMGELTITLGDLLILMSHTHVLVTTKIEENPMVHDRHDALPTVLEQIITLAKTLPHVELRALVSELTNYSYHRERYVEDNIKKYIVGE